MRQTKSGLWIVDEESIAEFKELSDQKGNGEVGCKPRKTTVGEVTWQREGAVCCAEPAADYITIPPESTWCDIVDGMEGYWAADTAAKHKLPDYNQGLHPLCWLFSLADTVRTERVCEGLPYVELAPESGIGASNYRDVGFYCDEALSYIAKHGFAARKYVDPYSLNPRRWKDGTEENALLHVPLEWWDGGKKDMIGELLALLKTGKSAYAWADEWAHAFKLDKFIREGNKIYPSGPNSWGPNQRFVLKMEVSGFFVIRSVTSSLN
jgi:hypothetical protein